MKPQLKQPLTSGERWFRALGICTLIMVILMVMKYKDNELRHAADQAFTDSLTRANLKVDTLDAIQGGQITDTTFNK